MKAIKIIILLSFMYVGINAQPYVYLDTEIKGLIQSNANWIDVNKDGYPDLIVSGERYSANQQIIKTHLYVNNKKGGFYRQNSGILDFYRSAVDWVDFDKDGDSDVFVSGETADHRIVARMYKNNGRGYFSSFDLGVMPVRDGDVSFGDFNNDGRTDLLMIGENNGQVYSRVYQNIQNAQFKDINAGLVPLYHGSAKWGDYDNDNDLDILISGETAHGVPTTKLYQNRGDNSFYDTNIPMEGIRLGDALFADFDGDNDLDIFICGENLQNHLVTRLYRNDGNGKYTELPSSMLGMRSGNVEANDFDCDGDIDLLVSGESFYGPMTKVYRNDGDFKFVDVNTQLPGVYMGGAYWADFDNDCDFDLFLIGLDDCYDFEAKLFRDERAIDIEPAKPVVQNNLWIQTDMSFAERKSYYYFVWSGCFCDPQDKAPSEYPYYEAIERDNDYHVFISNIHLLKRTHELQERFNSIILRDVINWADINGGHRVSIGYETYEEAVAAREQVIKDYVSERFTVNQVIW
ncbi:MAG: hypothetical protein CL663_02325 [Bacteroidetes bacterium]|nr:hypothetical protein [Bacteroidota bacterium]